MPEYRNELEERARRLVVEVGNVEGQLISARQRMQRKQLKNVSTARQMRGMVMVNAHVLPQFKGDHVFRHEAMSGDFV